MAKGAIPFLWAVAGNSRFKDERLGIFGFEKADVVICVGYDIVEYHPEQWNPDENKGIVYIEVSRAEVDEHYILKIGLGRLGRSPTCDSREAKPRAGYSRRPLREVIVNEIAEFAATTASRSSRSASHGACGGHMALAGSGVSC